MCQKQWKCLRMIMQELRLHPLKGVRISSAKVHLHHCTWHRQSKGGAGNQGAAGKYDISCHHGNSVIDTTECCNGYYNGCRDRQEEEVAGQPCMLESGWIVQSLMMVGALICWRQEASAEGQGQVGSMVEANCMRVNKVKSWGCQTLEQAAQRGSGMTIPGGIQKTGKWGIRDVVQ